MSVALVAGPPLTTYTPTEIRAIAIQSIVEGNSPRIGTPIRAVIAGVKARKAEPLVVPSMLTMRRKGAARRFPSKIPARSLEGRYRTGAP